MGLGYDIVRCSMIFFVHSVSKHCLMAPTKKRTSVSTFFLHHATTCMSLYTRSKVSRSQLSWKLAFRNSREFPNLFLGTKIRLFSGIPGKNFPKNFPKEFHFNAVLRSFQAVFCHKTLEKH